MRQASRRVLAAGLALLVGAGGCAIGPDWLNPLSKRSGRQASSRLDFSRPKDSGTLAFSTPMDPSADPLSLANEATPSAELHVAAARLAERSGKTADGENHYQQALKIDPHHVDALVGTARLKDRQGRLEEATRLYQRATQDHADNASLLNDLGLCLARQKKYKESIAAFERAIALEPKKWLYRNNVAMVLVETGEVDAAVSHLKTVQGESVAHYNVGYILQKKGDSEAAREHFARALEKNPSLAQARIWLEKLGRKPASFAQAAPLVASQRKPDDGSVRITDQPSGSRPADHPATTLLPPLTSPVPGPAARTPTVERLPPVADAARTAARSPGPPSRARNSRVAPLPPPSSFHPAPSGVDAKPGGVPAVLPLPSVNAAKAPTRLP